MTFLTVRFTHLIIAAMLITGTLAGIAVVNGVVHAQQQQLSLQDQLYLMAKSQESQLQVQRDLLANTTAAYEARLETAMEWLKEAQKPTPPQAGSHGVLKDKDK